MSMDVSYADLRRLQEQIADLTLERDALSTENGTLRAQVERLEGAAARSETFRVDL